MEISPNIRQITSGFVHFYLLTGSGGPVLIDTGLRSSHKQTLACLGELGLQPGDLQNILITHADGDHFGGLAGLQAAGASPAWASLAEAEAIRQGRASRKLKPRGLAKALYALLAPLFKSSPARIDHLLAGGEVFHILDGLQAIPTPGHTPGHISFYAPARKTLFAGDSIQVIAGRPACSAGANTWDTAQAQASFQLQMDLQPDLILAGHGVWKRAAR